MPTLKGENQLGHLRAIIVEDYEADAELIKFELKRVNLEIDAIIVSNETDYRKALNDRVNLIISDHNLPQFDSLRALKIMKQSGLDIPFIIVSGTIREETAVECMKLGAADYLLKDRMARLGQATLHALEQKRLRDENKRSHDALNFLAETSGILIKSLDLEETLQNLADLVVGKLADYCDIWIKGEQNVFSRIAIAYKSEFTIAGDLDAFSPQILEIEDPVLLKDLGSYRERVTNPNCHYNKILIDSGFQSTIVTPLISRKKLVGNIVFASGPNSKKLDDIDLEFFIELSWRMAMAIDNAKMYQKTKQARDEAKHLYLEAQKADRLKDEFLATVSHELRTPLNAIIGFSKLFLGNEVPVADSDRYMEIIHRSANNQLQIVSDLLDISKIIAGKVDVKRSAVQMTNVIDAAIGTVELAAKAKSIKIVKSIEENVRPILGDPERLQQVVWNLLANAVKFTPKGGQIDITLKETSSKVELIIKDNGRGIDSNFLPFVFERFKQENSSLTRQFGGLGLGLSIVRYIVELHGGEISASSGGEKMGATFTARFPVLAIEFPHEQYTNEIYRTEKETVVEIAGKKNGSLPNRDSSLLKGINVMVIDDSADALELVKLYLEHAGASVVPLGSAKVALKQIHNKKPNIVLCDISMPEMDGYTFVESQRSRESNPAEHLPIVALTAFAGENHRNRAIASGFDEHIAKPVNIEKLVEVIARLV